LHTFLEQLVALRHEVNLQTRASRGQQEQNAETLRQLSQALDALRQSQQTAQQATQAQLEDRLRPLLKTLVDLHDALSLAWRQVQRVQDSLAPVLDQLAAEAEERDEPLPPPPLPPVPPAAPPKRSFLARWFGIGQAQPRDVAAQQEAANALHKTIADQQHLLAQLHQQLAAQKEHQRHERRQRQEQARQAVQRVRQVIASVVTGYTMSLQRVERALQQYELEPIPCVGQPFDPETMEAVEVVTESGRPASEVIEEVRRGYRWHGRVFRYAQVRVARP
jgi:molecular chaperone GrpE